MSAYLCGIDVGTSGAKAMLVSEEGRVVSQGYAEYPTTHPRPGWAEQAPELWWRAVCAATRQMLKGAGQAPPIAAVSVSAQAPTMIALDAAGIAIHPALIWMDRRADEQAVRLGERFGSASIHQRTGNRPDPFYVAAKILWYRENEPELFRRTRSFIQINGYINLRLTGSYSMDPVHAALLQLRRWDRDEYDAELCDACGVEPEQFPEVKQGHEFIGEVSRSAAEECGLPAGTRVVCGTVDGSAAALEAGAVDEGIAAEMSGTSTVLLVPNSRALTDPALIAMPHALPDAWLLLGAMSTSGACLRWFSDELAVHESETARRAGTDVFALLTDAAAKVPLGSGGVIFLPYMMGERSPIWQTTARGVFFGLTLSTRREEMVRAVFEGTAFAFYHNVETAKRSGAGLSEIRSVGGGSHNELWTQMKADVTGVPFVSLEQGAGAPFGDALLAGLGAGVWPDLREVLARTVRVSRRHEPRLEFTDRYRERYSVFRGLYDALRPVYDRAAGGRREPA